MRQLDYSQGYYRKRQTIVHRRMMVKQNRKYNLKTIYYAILLFFVIGTFINTINSKPKEEVKTITIPQPKQQPIRTTESKVQLIRSSILDFSLPEQFKAFAAEAKPSIIPLPTGDDNWANFRSEAHSISKIYGYPVNLIEAQAALESAHGTSSFAINKNNYFGIGAYDWQPNNAFYYENPAQSIIDYIYVVKNDFPEAWANRNDSTTMLNLLESNDQGSQYASDPQYVYKVESMPEWSEN